MLDHWSWILLIFSAMSEEAYSFGKIYCENETIL